MENVDPSHPVKLGNSKARNEWENVRADVTTGWMVATKTKGNLQYSSKLNVDRVQKHRKQRPKTTGSSI